MWNRSTGCPTHGFALVVCRHPLTQKWLAVLEQKNRGWWLPGGFVEGGDDFVTTAHKECLEEAGINIDLKGVLRVEHSMDAAHRGARMRVIFYALPSDPNQIPKQVADRESVKAEWLSLPELQDLSTKEPPEGLRGPELLDWAAYIENGGTIYPLEVFTTEHAAVPIVEKKNTEPHQEEG